jgi:hypothetical protein
MSRVTLSADMLVVDPWTGAGRSSGSGEPARVPTVAVGDPVDRASHSWGRSGARVFGGVRPGSGRDHGLIVADGGQQESTLVGGKGPNAAGQLLQIGNGALDVGVGHVTGPYDADLDPE